MKIKEIFIKFLAAVILIVIGIFLVIGFNMTFKTPIYGGIIFSVLSIIGTAIPVIFRKD